MSNSSVSHFMDTSTIHGLAEINHAKTYRERIFFVFVLLGCNAMAIYGVYQIIYQFIDRPVATSYFVIESPALYLPDVTICQFNRFNLEKLKQEKLADMATYLDWSFFPITPKYDFVNDNLFKRARANPEMFRTFSERLTRKLKEKNMNYEQFINYLGITCNDTVLSCAQQYIKDNNCCDHLTSSGVTALGKCFRASGRLQKGSGFGMGLTFHLKLPLQNYSETENSLMNDGVMIKLTEPGKGYEFDAIFVPPGVHALLQLRATRLEFKNDPPRFSCNDKNTSFSPHICQQHCVLQPMQEMCGCRYIGIPFNWTMDGEPPDPSNAHRACEPGDMLDCILPNIGKFYKTNKVERIEFCKKRCVTRCSYWQYQSTVSYAKFPSAVMAKQYFVERTGSEAGAEREMKRTRETEIVLELFYEKLEYTLIKHFASMTPDQFVANIGGQMGLWMGGSILSFVHLIVFLCLCSEDKTRTTAKVAKDRHLMMIRARKEKRLSRARSVDTGLRRIRRSDENGQLTEEATPSLEDIEPDNNNEARTQFTLE